MKKKNPSVEELITVNEAARLRGVHPEVIRGYIKRGRLPSVRKFEKRLVWRADVIALVRQKPGPKPKKKPPGE